MVIFTLDGYISCCTHLGKAAVGTKHNSKPLSTMGIAAFILPSCSLHPFSTEKPSRKGLPYPSSSGVWAQETIFTYDGEDLSKREG